jgi:hypothetical protein
MEAAEKYLRGFPEEQDKTYDPFIDDLIGNRGFFKAFFQLMKKMFQGSPGGRKAA